MTIIWCMVLEIHNVTDIIFCRSRPVFALLPPNNPKNQNFENMKKTQTDAILCMYTINDNHMMYHSCGAWQAEFFVILAYFLHFYPHNNPKNQNFEIMKKPPGDIITLHMCTINDNHMMYGSWDMECDGQNFLSFWTVFCPFTPLTTQKIKILKKWKKHLEILSFYTSVP